MTRVFTHITPLLLLAALLTCKTPEQPPRADITPKQYSATPFTSTVHPVECPGCVPSLEPSGILVKNNTVYFVSDDATQQHIYRLQPGGRTYRAKVALSLRFPQNLIKSMTHKLDLEGMSLAGDGVALVDERNRNIYIVSKDGIVTPLTHDIGIYNLKHGITFSDESNAGFEGIAIDQKTDTWYIANERDRALVYVLTRQQNTLKAASHIDLQNLLNDPQCDISDIYYEKSTLYLVYRKKRIIIKLDPRTSQVLATLSFAEVTGSLYTSAKGYGFAEGLFMTHNTVFLLLDSNGNSFRSREGGEHGCMIIFPRPQGF
jgi:hypothetical protein